MLSRHLPPRHGFPVKYNISCRVGRTKESNKCNLLSRIVGNLFSQLYKLAFGFGRPEFKRLLVINGLKQWALCISSRISYWL